MTFFFTWPSVVGSSWAEHPGWSGAMEVVVQPGTASAASAATRRLRRCLCVGPSARRLAWQVCTWLHVEGWDRCRGFKQDVELMIYYPELQRTPQNSPVTTPRSNLAFVKPVNFDEITCFYIKVKRPWRTFEQLVKRLWTHRSQCFPTFLATWVNCSLQANLSFVRTPSVNLSFGSAGLHGLACETAPRWTSDESPGDIT